MEVAMTGIYRFLKSTVIGGLLVLVPVVVLGAFLVWVVQTALKAIAPALDWLPEKSVAGVSLTLLIAVGGLVAGCFLAGLVAQTAIIQQLSGLADRFALFLPGYALMKHVGANIIGVEAKHPARTVLVRFEGWWQLGFQMETLPDGRQVVFLPGVPRALVGTLHIVPADRVQVLSMSVSAALDALSRLGIGLREAWVKESFGHLPETAVRPAE
jgi:uncharacterized membrane protein